MTAKAKALKAIYYLYGQDEFLLKNRLAEIRERLEPEAREFNFAQFQVGEASVGDILASALALPMVSDRRLVVVWQAQRLAQSDSEKLAGAMEDPPKHLSLVLVGGEGARVEKSRLFKLAKAKGEVIACNPPKKPGYISWIRKEFAERGVEVGEAAAAHILDRASHDLHQLKQEKDGRDFYRLENEIEKIHLYYIDQRSVSLDEVRELLDGPVEGTVFQMIDALSKREVSEALTILDLLFKNRRETGIVFHMLLRHFRLLMKTQALLEKGVEPKALASMLSPGRPLQSFVVGKLRTQSRNFSFLELRRALKLLLEADIALKSTDSEAQVVIEDLIFRLFSAPSSSGYSWQPSS